MIHALVDALGNPANLMFAAGQIHDLASAQELIIAVPHQVITGASLEALLQPRGLMVKRPPRNH